MLRAEVQSLRMFAPLSPHSDSISQHTHSVAATQTPIIFLGVGEHLTDLDRFSPQPFISKLLGLGDVQGLMEHMQDLAQANPDKQKEMARKLEEGKLSIRDWREQIQNIMSMYDMSLLLRFIVLIVITSF
jgi:signal recognition particle subunit SRP54